MIWNSLSGIGVKIRVPWITSLTWKKVPIKKAMIKLITKEIILPLFKNWWSWFVKTFFSFTKFGWDWPSDSSEDCLISSMYFRYFPVTYPWNWAVHFISTHMNSLQPRMLCAKAFVWLKSARWFSRRRNFYFVSVFLLFRDLILLEMGGVLHLNELNSLHQRKRCAMQGWMKLA